MFAYCGNNLTTFSLSAQTTYSNLIARSDGIIVEAYHIEAKIPVVNIRKFVKYDVPLYDQSMYSLCWAFCQIMVEDYRDGVTRTNIDATNQAISLAKQVNGEDWNRGAWPTNTTNLFSEWGKPVPSSENLYDYLFEYGPIYAYYSSKQSAHLIVVTGVDLDNNIIYTNNPWGIYGEQSYEEFLSGFAGLSSNSDMHFGFVIFPDI